MSRSTASTIVPRARRADTPKVARWYGICGSPGYLAELASDLRGDYFLRGPVACQEHAEHWVLWGEQAAFKGMGFDHGPRSYAELP